MQLRRRCLRAMCASIRLGRARRAPGPRPASGQPKPLPTRQRRRRRRHDALAPSVSVRRSKMPIAFGTRVKNKSEKVRNTCVKCDRASVDGEGGVTSVVRKIIDYGGEDSPRCAISPGLCPHSGGRRSKRHERTPRRGPCQSPHTSRAVGAVPYPLTALRTALSLWRSARGCKAAPSCAARGRGGARRCAGPRP